jgi:hypothetical protein
MSIKVECTWGEGSDIVVMGEKQKIINLSEVERVSDGNYGFQEYWQLDLTIEEAKNLVSSLEKEIAMAEKLRSICEHMPEKGSKD